MPLPTFFYILKTTSSEVSKKTLYKSRFTYFVPDLFFIFLYMSFFFFSGVLDAVFISILFLRCHNIAPGAIFVVTVIFPGIFEFLLISNNEDCVPNIKINKSFKFFLSVLGFNAVFNSSIVLVEIFSYAGKSLVKPLTCFTYPFFQTQNESLSEIKVHCLINSALKSLPRLFILPIFILHNGLEGVSAFLGVIIITMSVILFSLTIAITFPIRSSPRVFTSSFCVLLNAFNKFMATMSSCGVIMAIFATTFKSIHFYALFVPFLRCITWGWPCWKVLKSRSVPLSETAFLIFFFLFTFFSSFIYIHHFEGIGKLHYYFFYFLDFLEEIIVIYMFTDVPLDFVTTFFCFRVVMIGFLSSFGLVNILHKYKDEKTNCGCMSSSNITERPDTERNLEENETIYTEDRKFVA